MKRLQLYLLGVMEGEKKGVFIKPFLFFFSLVFQGIVWFRRKCFELGLFKTEKAPLFVVSVGNLVVGGTGKTPFIELLVSSLNQKSAILSRGYKSIIEERGLHLALSDLSPECATPVFCGDEPYLLYKRLPQTLVCVGKERMRLALIAKNRGAELALLDDGMQHLKIYRDKEIILLSSHDLFGKNAFLPFGFLRDHPKHLAKADLIVINGIENETQFSSAATQVKKYSSSPVIGVKVIVKNPSFYSGLKVGLFSGIASPQRFKKTVTDLACEILEEMYTLDHETFSQEELIIFAEKCTQKGASHLLCTEKDFIKLKPFSLSLPIHPVIITLTVLSGEEAWYTFLNSLQHKVGHERRDYFQTS